MSHIFNDSIPLNSDIFQLCFYRFLQDDAQRIMHCFRGQRNQTEDNRQYSSSVRKFSLTMHFHSPRAYQYLRDKFGNTLPHVSTLRKWYANSDTKGEPGILPEAMLTLKSLAEKMKSEGKRLLISVCCDETAMKRNVQWSHEQKKFSGFVTETKANGEHPIAGNVLVFMATILHAKDSIPIAYYCVAGLNGAERSVLLTKVLVKLHETGVLVANITFDGLRANFTMCEILGASFDVNNLIPYIKHPVDGSKVYILLDACHLIKLFRNLIGDYGRIQDPNLGQIEWKYFERLLSYREKNNFVTHRLTKHHILFQRNRMNVRLAVQLFSKAVASTMEYLRNSGDKFFKNSKATIKLAYTMDSIFDIFNAKGIKQNEPLKSAINENNARQVFDFFEETKKYLISLRLNGILCVNSRRSTAFVGLITNIASAQHMYEDFVLTGHLENLALFYNSQDFLESFFSRIRSLLGCNDNPNAQEFKAAIRKLLFFNEISSSVFANCEDNLNILTISSQNPAINSGLHITTEQNIRIENAEIETNEDNFEEIEQLAMSPNDHNSASQLESKEHVTIAYIAGTIEKKINSSKFGCEECENVCKNIFEENEKIVGHFIENCRTQRPCCSSYIICKHAHQVFVENLNFATFDYKEIHKLTSERILDENLFLNTDFSHDYEHKSYLVEYIVDEYVRAYATYVAQCLTIEQQKILIRNINRKTTHFRGQ